MLKQDIHSALAVDDDLEITFHYGGEPVLYPGIKRTFEVSLRQDDKPLKAELKIKAPKGWTVSTPVLKGHRYQMDIQAKEVAPRNTLTVLVKLAKRSYEASFTVLGPDEAKGFPSTKNVEVCHKCGARQESCICK